MSRLPAARKVATTTLRRLCAFLIFFSLFADNRASGRNPSAVRADPRTWPGTVQSLRMTKPRVDRPRKVLFCLLLAGSIVPVEEPRIDCSQGQGDWPVALEAVDAKLKALKLSIRNAPYKR